MDPELLRLRPANIDLPKLGLELADVVLHGCNKALHMLGARNDPRSDFGLGLLGLDVDEIQRKLGFRVIDHRHVDVNPLGDVVIELNLKLNGLVFVGHASLSLLEMNANGEVMSTRLRRQCGIPEGERSSTNPDKRAKLVGECDPW